MIYERIEGVPLRLWDNVHRRTFRFGNTGVANYVDEFFDTYLCVEGGASSASGESVCKLLSRR